MKKIIFFALLVSLLPNISNAKTAPTSPPAKEKLSLSVTCRSKALSKVQTALPPGRSGVYQIGKIIQLDAKTVGFFMNIRHTKIKAYDVELGTDFCFTRDPELRKFEGFQPISRAETVAPFNDDRKYLMVAYPLSVAFVPLGALLEDGSPHPHAGTGFAIGVRLGRLLDSKKMVKGYANPMREDCYDELEILQLAWDGSTLKVTERRRLPFITKAGKLTKPVAPRGPLSGIVADGEDLLTGLLQNINGEKLNRPGVCRWKRRNGRWEIAGFTPIGAPGSSEPSLVRALDGSLLYTHRTVVKNWTPALKTSPEGMADAVHVRDIRVWRSRDNGKTWQQTLHKKNCCNACPVSIAMALDGTPVIFTNVRSDKMHSGKRRFHGSIREKMKCWVLTPAGDGIVAEKIIRDTNREFGRSPNNRGWYFDHPISLIVRLGDGKWHSIVTFRNLALAEGGYGKGATPYTGLYIEKIFTPGTRIKPPWKFQK